MRKHVTADVLAALRSVFREFERSTQWAAPVLHELIVAQSVQSGLSLGKVAQPIRLAVTGGTVSPPIDATLAILGREETLSRLSRAFAAWGA